MDEGIKIIYRQIEERMCKVIWTHAIQLEEAKCKSNRSKWLRFTKQGLSIISSGGIITLCFTSFGWEKWLEIGTAFFTMMLTLITWLCDNRLDAEASRGRYIASELHDLRNKYESLLADMKAECIDIENILRRMDELESMENEIYSKDLPMASKRALRVSSKSLKVDYQAKTTNDELKAMISGNLLMED